MNIALNLGRRMRGMTAYNPAVGCVITNEINGKEVIISRGWTNYGGRPHAEAMAMAKAENKLKDACVYVTLEPCAHEGNTPSCARALVAAGVNRVVTALEDPDPRTRGKGHAILIEAGINLISDVCSDIAKNDMAGFLSRVERKRPYVTLKLAISRNGKIAAAKGKKTAITGNEVWRKVHALRAHNDAILVGGETVRVDNPRLDCRLSGFEGYSPIKVILTNRLNFQESSHIFDNNAVNTILATNTNNASYSSEMYNLAELLTLSSVNDGGYNKVDVVMLLEKLADKGINYLLVEGGAKTAAEFLKESLVDEVFIFKSPKNLPERAAIPALYGLPIEFITNSSEFILHDKQVFGEDNMYRYKKSVS